MRRIGTLVASGVIALNVFGAAAPAYAAGANCVPGEIRMLEGQVYECIMLRDGSTHWHRVV